MKKHIRKLAVVVAAVAASMGSPAAFSDNSHADHWDEQALKHQRAVGLLKQVQDATRRFRDVSVAMAEGYAPFLGCVSGPQAGAMGIHFVNGDLVGDNLLDAERPEVLIYEPGKNGQMRFVGVEFIVTHEGWHAGNELPPALTGQVFHFSGSPNRYGLPPFYELHVWAWRDNPNGAFVDWNPRVTCGEYQPQ